jgi:putative FmdB family regulatory protein
VTAGTESLPPAILLHMATYEYICLGCEQPFEQRRSMSAVDTALECPSCGSDRVRRRFSVFASGVNSAPGAIGPAPSAGGGCCGGGCACGG